jgi:hypothetical protein
VFAGPYDSGIIQVTLKHRYLNMDASDMEASRVAGSGAAADDGKKGLHVYAGGKSARRCALSASL